jgi:protease YdgD
MVGKLLRCLLLLGAFGVAMPAAASASTVQQLGPHRADVDATRYPWSAIGKLYNETGSACSGVVIAEDKILTAAHCVFNFRSRRFIPATALHFLVGYRTGRYAVHARIASYQVGEGFDPLRYGETSDADWAVLTVTESLPAEIAPLRLSQSLAQRGTKAVLVGYPQDRAHAMTADRDCELRDEIDGGRFLLHTCRGIKGYSGAPILVNAGGDEMQIAGIQIATLQSGGMEKAIAVPAQAIWRQDRNRDRDRGHDVVPGFAREPAASQGAATAVISAAMVPMADTIGSWDEVGFEGDIVSAILGRPDQVAANQIASFDLDPLVIAAP